MNGYPCKGCELLSNICKMTPWCQNNSLVMNTPRSLYFLVCLYQHLNWFFKYWFPIQQRVMTPLCIRTEESSFSGVFGTGKCYILILVVVFITGKSCSAPGGGGGSRLPLKIRVITRNIFGKCEILSGHILWDQEQLFDKANGAEKSRNNVPWTFLVTINLIIIHGKNLELLYELLQCI